MKPEQPPRRVPCRSRPWSRATPVGSTNCKPETFSCKARAVCSSCGGRRMAERAAHLVEAVLPAVPVRQWVLTGRKGQE